MSSKRAPCQILQVKILLRRYRTIDGSWSQAPLFLFGVQAGPASTAPRGPARCSFGTVAPPPLPLHSAAICNRQSASRLQTFNVITRTGVNIKCWLLLRQCQPAKLARAQPIFFLVYPRKHAPRGRYNASWVRPNSKSGSKVAQPGGGASCELPESKNKRGVL